MGYQEAFRPIEHLAESEGIRRAIEDYRDNPHLPEYCHYACTARERATGRLYACVIGQRCRVMMVAGIFLDYCIPDGKDYADYYEDLDEDLVRAAAEKRPDLVEKAYREVAASFDRGVEEGIRRERALREEACGLWPNLSSLLLACGPLPERSIAAHPLFEGHFMWNVLVDLKRQGLIACDGDFPHDSLRLSDKAMEELGIDEMPAPLSKDDLLTYHLRECGPLSSSVLSGLLNLSRRETMKILHHHMDDGRVAAEGRGRTRRYRYLSDSGSVAAGLSMD